ncbi:MAG: hypothetical protein ACRCV3_05560 [Desulfovibrionaceae bacterium]
MDRGEKKMEINEFIERIAEIFALELPLIVAIIVALSSVLAVFLPSSKSTNIGAKIYRVIYAIVQILAMNIGKAKNEEDGVPANREKKKK